MSVRTRQCLRAHTGVYVDAIACTHTQMSSFAQRMSGRGWTHIFSHLHGRAHTRALKKLTHTRARTRENMHVRASWHYIACARTRTCICALCALVGPHMCLQLHRHVCLCTRNTSKHANTHTRKPFFNTYTCVRMKKHTLAKPRPRAARYSARCIAHASAHVRARLCIFGCHMCL